MSVKSLSSTVALSQYYKERYIKIKLYLAIISTFPIVKCNTPPALRSSVWRRHSASPAHGGETFLERRKCRVLPGGPVWRIVWGHVRVGDSYSGIQECPGNRALNTIVWVKVCGHVTATNRSLIRIMTYIYFRRFTRVVKEWECPLPHIAVVPSQTVQFVQILSLPNYRYWLLT